MKIQPVDHPQSDEEAHLHRLLDGLRLDYEQRSRPIIERLAFIKSRTMPRYFLALEPGEILPAGLLDADTPPAA